MNWIRVRYIISIMSLAICVVSLPFSVTICHGAAIIFLMAWLAGGEWKEKWNTLKGNFLLQVIILFFFIHLVGLLYTLNRENGFFDIEKKIFMLLLPIAVATSQDTRKKETLLIISLFTGVCFLSSVYCLIHASVQLQLLAEGAIQLPAFNYLGATNFSELYPDEHGGWMLFSYLALASGIHLHPTYFSLYIAFSILFLMHLLTSGESMKNRRHRIMIWVLIILFWLFTLMLSSRIIIAALLLISGVMIFNTKINNRHLYRRVFIVFTVSFFLMMSLNPVLRYRAWQEIIQSSYRIEPSSNYSVSTEIRGSLWWLSWKSLKGINLLWGTGTGTTGDVIADTRRQFGIHNTLNTNDPHNQYFSTLISHGFSGLSVLLIVLLLPLYIGWRRGDQHTVTFCLLMLITCLTESVLSLQKGIIFFSVFYPLLILKNSDYKFSFQPKNIVISEGTRQP